MRVRDAIHCGLMVGLLAACGSPHDAPASSSYGKADVTITVDGVLHACNVALAAESQASSVACADMVPFLRDELRLPSGAAYDLRSDKKADPAELATISANLKGAGYRSLDRH